MTDHTCRFCSAPLTDSFCDLGVSPLSNAYLDTPALDRMEPFYPLHARVCRRCFLVQLPVHESPDNIFSDYAYFSSYSDSWLAHAQAYAVAVRERFGLGPASRVVELASNDGYLLQYFHAAGIPVLGIEPAANVAAEARRRGIDTRVEFFGTVCAQSLVRDGVRADLLAANNVLAHVPDLNDFVAGMKILLASDGVVTVEFPHLLTLMRENQFDTIYHEHFSYFSLGTVRKVFAHHGLELFDVEELVTHGGSLRVFAAHAGTRLAATVSPRLTGLLTREDAAGLTKLDTYSEFEEGVREAKRSLLEFLIATRRAGKSVVGYGAPAKGNTLLNYCGVRTDMLDYTVDRSPHKQGKYLPGTRIPIFAPERIAQTRPDYVLILPWNLRDEVTRQMAHIRDWGGRFVIPIPRVEVIE